MEASIIECLICLQSPKLAVETECCGQIFCEQCLTGVENRICPGCRKDDVKSYPNRVVRRLLENKDTECPNKCGAKFNLSELMKHMKVCEKNSIICPAPDCCSKFDQRQDFLTHLITEHSKETFENASTLFQQKVSTETQTAVFAAPLFTADEFDLTEPVQNRAGRRARMNHNGKFYCGTGVATCSILGHKNSTTCHCEGRCCYFTTLDTCGPRYGCNCTPCQELDLKFRGVTKKGWLVASNGALCKFIPHKARKAYSDGWLVCGRRTLEGDNDGRFDSYCGYTPGKVCKWCLDMKKHIGNGLYKNLLEQLPEKE